MKDLLLLSLLSLVFVFNSCIKDEFTKPAEVTFEFWLSHQEINGKFLELQTGTMVIKEIGFEGYREKGENIFFTSNFENLIIANLAMGSTTKLIKFDIPQGIYHHINLTIEIDKNNQDPSLVLNGKYNSATRGQIPVKFEFEFNEILNLNPKPGKGKSKIVLNQDISSTAEVIIDTGFMFQLVNSRMLESAEIVEHEGEDIISISKDNNLHIFNVLVNRIEKSTTALFY